MKINNKTHVVIALLMSWAGLATAAVAPDVTKKKVWFINESGYHSGEIWIGSPIADNFLKTATKKVPIAMKEPVLLGAITGTARNGQAIRYEMKEALLSYAGMFRWNDIIRIEGDVLVTFKSGLIDRRLYVELSSM
jgi:hypothetical protein